MLQPFGWAHADSWSGVGSPESRVGSLQGLTAFDLQWHRTTFYKRPNWLLSEAWENPFPHGKPEGEDSLRPHTRKLAYSTRVKMGKTKRPLLGSLLGWRRRGRNAKDELFTVTRLKEQGIAPELAMVATSAVEREFREINRRTEVGARNRLAICFHRERLDF